MSDARKNLDVLLSVGYVYDAVWTIALALNSSISILEERGLGRLEDFTYNSTKMADVFKEAVANVSFQGISVSFNACVQNVMHVSFREMYHLKMVIEPMLLCRLFSV